MNEEVIETVTEQISDSEAAPEKEEATPVISPPEEDGENEVDYGELIRRDIEALRGEFPELSQLNEITQLKNPLRYAALRDLGLTPAEAYMATTPRHRPPDTRSHLTAAMPKAGVSSYGGMTKKEMDAARELFDDLSDTEIQALYRAVTG